MRTDKAIINPVYPTTIQEEYIQPEFNTKVYRVTWNQEFTGTKQVQGGFCNSEMSFWSNDGKFFCLEGYPKEKVIMFYFNENLDFVEKEVGFLKDNDQYALRWWNNSLIKVTGNEIQKFNELTKTWSRIWKYSKPLRLAGKEAGIYDNKIMLDDGIHIFVLDLASTGRYKLSNFPLGEIGSTKTPGLDYASPTPSGKQAILSWGYEYGTTTHYGIELWQYKPNWKFIRRLYPGVIHWTTGLDNNNRECIFTVLPVGQAQWIKDFIPAGMKQGDLIKIDIETGKITLLLHIPHWNHLDLCQTNYLITPGKLYCAYWGKDGESALYWNEILEIPTDGSQKVNRLCNHWTGVNPKGKKLNNKVMEPDINVSRDGKYLIFASNLNMLINGNYIKDTFLVRL